MFFIFGINSGTKQLDDTRTVICSRCGRYGRYQVFMTYMCFSLFFIPVFRWGRRYYVRTSCCGTVYELNPEVGRELARGGGAEIGDGDLTLAETGRGSWPEAGRMKIRRCSECGYETAEDFRFCPKCGKEFMD